MLNKAEPKTCRDWKMGTKPLGLLLRLGARAIAFSIAASAAASQSADTVDKFLFAIPSNWVYIEGLALNGDDLLFRRYAVVFKDNELYKFFSIPNIMFFGCRRELQLQDHLAIHLPPAKLKSFSDREGSHRVEVRLKYDRTESKMFADYVNGDIFLMLPYGSLAQIVDSPKITIEFGERNDRVEIIVGNKLPSGGDVDGFLRAALKTLSGMEGFSISGVPESRFHYFDTKEMLAACARFKKTGKYK
jgi:hypothetical protein